MGKRAVSNILANFFLILLVVVGAVLIYAFVFHFLERNNLQKSFDIFLEELENSTSPQFSLGIPTPETPDNFVLVSSCQEFSSIRNNLSGVYVLGGDIDCSDSVNWNNGVGFPPIWGVFEGILDGQGYKIKESI